MENFLGIHPAPPPANVKIEEPDVRSARTIKEVLEAHRSDKTCAACHQSIDPFGYAFENCDPVGGWRDVYDMPAETSATDEATKANGRRGTKPAGIPIDASASFLSALSSIPAATIDCHSIQDLRLSSCQLIEIHRELKESAEEPGTKGVVFELGLLAGKTEVRTWLYDWDRKDGAAYFIEVELL